MSDSSETYSCSIVPTLSQVVSSVIALATPLKWTSVNVVISAYSTHQALLASFIGKCASNKLIVRETFILDGTDAALTSTATGLHASTSRVHVLFCSPEDAAALIKKASLTLQANGDNVWVGTHGWLDAGPNSLLEREKILTYISGGVLGLVPVWNAEKKTKVDAKLILKSEEYPGPGAYFAYDALVFTM